MNIDTLIFDMYGVIIKESKGNFIPYTLEHFDKSWHERLIRQLKDEQLFTKAGNGEFTSNEFLSRLGFSNPEYHMHNYIEHYLTLDDSFIEFAEKYFDKYNFILLSNDVVEWSAYITKYYKLNKYFQYKIVSGDVGCRKPGKEIFQTTLSKINKNAGQCLFVDNSSANLKTASSLGFVSVLFNRDKEDYNGKIVNSFWELENFMH